ncbi:hypothetical protein [Motiliproteus sediminis]|uniref:hypothetical protein n=1 Tax=Motiliproteus sediminis TaxID=1468178 RepID=UPI001AEFF66E|nr:hypothetical protein [Motiliproteus sediminis]
MSTLLRTTSSYAIALSIAYLATVLLFWRSELQRLDRLDQQVGQVTGEMAKWRELLPSIINEIELSRAEIPPILEESAALRETLPGLLAEVAAVRALAQSAIAEATEIRAALPEVLAEVSAVRETLPTITRESESWRQTVPLITTEVAAVRELTPQILEEIDATREALPDLMDRAEDLIAEAKVAGRKASEGAVTGVFTGLVTAPFSIMRGLSSSLFGTSELSADDMELLRQSGHKVVNAPAVGAQDSWRNRKTDVRGKSELLSIEMTDDTECRIVRFEASKKGRSLFDKRLPICRSGDGDWHLEAD